MTDVAILRPVMEHLRSFEESVFRLEALDQYTSDAEDEAMRRYFAGEALAPKPQNEYYELVRAARAAGKPWRRVHAVTAATPYLRFEIDVYYSQNEAAGEEIGILEHPDLAEVFGAPPPDFWLFDDSTVIDMQYDETGRIAATHLVDDPAAVGRYLQLRDTALRHAVPLRDYRAALRRLQLSTTTHRQAIV
jgi:hypothetical protein